MSHAIIQNPSAAQEPPAPPPHPDGGSWMYEMIYSGGANRAYSDTVEDLMEVLIPGYVVLDEPNRAHARITLAEMARVTAQAAFIADLDDAVDDQTLTAIEDQPFVGEWEGPFPLVLITSHYAPYSAVARPEGAPLPDGRPRIAWLDVANPSTLLEGLHGVGDITLSVRAD